MGSKRVFARILLFPLVLLAVVVTLTSAHLVVEAASLTAPTSLAASAVSSSQITLTWVDTTKSETGFQVERSLSATSGFALIGTTGKNVTSYGDSTVGSGTSTARSSVRTSCPAARSAAAGAASPSGWCPSSYVDTSSTRAPSARAAGTEERPGSVPNVSAEAVTGIEVTRTPSSR